MSTTRIARVVGPATSSDGKVLQNGRVRIRVLPEMAQTDETALPFATVVYTDYSGVSYKEGYPKRAELPRKDSYIIVEIDDTWTEFWFHGEVPVDYSAYGYTRSSGDGYGDLLATLPAEDITFDKGKDYQDTRFSQEGRDLVFWRNLNSGEFGYYRFSSGTVTEYCSIGSTGRLVYSHGEDKKIIVDPEADQLTLQGYNTILVQGDSTNSEGYHLAYLEPLVQVLKSLIEHRHMTTHGISDVPIDSGKKPLQSVYTENWFKTLGTEKEG